ncbi:MAG: DUF6794 domain-containing protein [Nitrososphaeraceae archaeon]
MKKLLYIQNTSDSTIAYIINQCVYVQHQSKHLTPDVLDKICELSIDTDTGQVHTCSNPNLFLDLICKAYNIEPDSAIGRFLSEDEIIEDFISTTPKIELDDLLAIDYTKLILYHNSIGREIRNKYQLWYKTNPYTDASDGNGDKHPDNLSFRLLQQIWKRLNENSNNGV